MIRARSGYGIGDNLYMYFVVRWLIEQGRTVEVCTDYPEIFSQLRVNIDKFSRHDIRVLCHYTKGKRRQDTSQWQDVCDSAGVPRSVPMELCWEPQNPWLVDALRREAAGRPIVAVLMARPPMGREDGFGAELLPKPGAINRVLDDLEDCYTVKIGRGKELQHFRTDLDLSNETDLTELLDVATVCDAFVGYPSFMVPLAEGLNKPGLFVWARGGLEVQSGRAAWFVRAITPKKVLHKPNWYFVDDCPAKNVELIIREWKNAFCNQDRSLQAVAQ